MNQQELEEKMNILLYKIKKGDDIIEELIQHSETSLQKLHNIHVMRQQYTKEFLEARKQWMQYQR